MKTTALLACALALLAAGCATEKKQPLAQRGWIGGEYALARPAGFIAFMSSQSGVVGTLPKSVQQTQRTAIQIMRLDASAPAALAGLHKDDFILECNRQRILSLRDFRRTIDHSAPGSQLDLKLYRTGLTTNCSVTVGCEKYKPGGCFSVCFPSVVHGWDLWPNPGFSLVFLGCESNPGLRHELDKNSKKSDVYDEEWSTYLIFFELSHGKRIQSEEPYPTRKG